MREIEFLLNFFDKMPLVILCNMPLMKPGIFLFNEVVG